MDAPDRSATVAVHPSARGTVGFGPFRFDIGDRLLYRGDRELPLPPRALAVLAYLVERPNQVVTKRALMDAVWRDTFVEEASLKEAVSLVRQALDEDGQQPRFIQTIHRRGYRFAAPITLSPLAAAGSDRPPLAPVRSTAALGRWLIVPAALALVAAGVWAVEQPRAASPSRAVRFAIPLPGLVAKEEGDPRLDISPDGSRVAFVSSTGGVDRLYERRLDSLDNREVAGTEGATAPFFSPDGRWIGFFAGGRLLKAPVEGGAPITVCDVPEKIAGGSWNASGRIVFGSEAGVFVVAESGGTPVALTRVDPTRGEIGHWWPHVLPDGDSVTFTIWRTGLDRASLALVSPKRHEQRVLYEGGADGRYLPSGHLMFARSGGAATMPFDLATLRVAGPPAPLALDAAVNAFNGVLQVAVSDDGSLVYAPGSAAPPQLETTWVGADGTLTPLPLPRRPYRNIRLSPDNRRLAVTINEAANYDVWIADVVRGTLTRLTFGGRNIEPVWSRDGQWVVYGSITSKPFTMMRRRADGSGTAEEILTGDRPAFPSAFTPAGDALMFSVIDPATNFDVWVLPAGGKAWPFLHSPFEEVSPVFSPDGRAVAYASNESGSFEVYVRPYPGPGGKWQVSAAGGDDPFWSADGRRLFYTKGATLLAADIAWGAEPTIGRPIAVSDRRDLEWFGAARDGRLLALHDDARGRGPAQINVVVNWLNSVRQRLAGP